jgi:hypothetical protein
MGRKTPFQSKHEGEYGTKIASRNATGQVDSFWLAVLYIVVPLALADSKAVLLA